MKAEAEMGVMCQEAKEPQGLPPGAGKEAWSRSSLTASEGTNAADTLISDFSLQN